MDGNFCHDISSNVIIMRVNQLHVILSIVTLAALRVRKQKEISFLFWPISSQCGLYAKKLSICVWLTTCCCRYGALSATMRSRHRIALWSYHEKAKGHQWHIQVRGGGVLMLDWGGGVLMLD